VNIHLTAVIAGMLVLCATLAAGDEIGSNRQNLQMLQQRIDEGSRTLERQKGEEGSLADQLRALEERLAALQGRLRATEEQVRALEAEIAGRKKEELTLRQRSAELEVQVRKRLAALYKGGEAGTLRVLFGGDPPARAAENFDYFGRMIRRDRQLLEEYRRELAALQQVIDELAGLHRQQQKAMASLRADRQSLADMRKERQSVLTRLRGDQAALGQALREWREQANRLTNLIKKLESQRSPAYTPSGLFAKQKGRLPWPLTGSVRVGFGAARDPQLGTMRESHGIEIAATGSTPHPVTAVWGGRVVFAEVFRGFGPMLILDHGDGYYTLYAQLAKLSRKSGEQIAQGELLAHAGDSGGIYFEIRKGGVPLDPLTWLRPSVSGGSR
jgi:murein hydrolase activator